MINSPKGYVEYTTVNMNLPNPLEEHTGNSRWQTCNCRTCQEKRMKYDAMPGEKIDWAKFKKNLDA